MSPAELDLLRFAPFGCVILDGDVILAANQDATEVTSIPKDRLIGVPIADLVMPDFEPAVAEMLARAGSATATSRVRLARGLIPMEVSARGLGGRRRVAVIRSLEAEHRYSAMAGADLTHDQVTGFPNRYHLLCLLDQRLRAASRTPLALIGLWVDELAKLASSNGDRAVERVVKEVGQRVQARLRSPDLLGRYDDAGFLGLLSSDAPISQLTDIAQRLRAEVAFPVEVDTNLVSFTASVAVGSIGDPRPSIEKVMAKLEAAARRAAAGGGNRTEVLEL